MKILYVCTANICRSASAAALLHDAALPGVQVRSAGTVASQGNPGCPHAPALAGRDDQHRSQPLTAELVDWADLILSAAREHRTAVLALNRQARDKTFTIRQAGRLAQWLVDAGMVAAARQATPELFEEGDPRRFVTPLPDEPAGRITWLLAELDAARGMAPVPSAPAPASRRRRRGADEVQHPDDIPDPHVLGLGWHQLAYEQLRESTEATAVLLREVLA